MTLRYGSASAWTRISKCVGPTVLPRLSSTAGEPAIRGTIIHEFIHNITKIGKEKALDLVPAHYRAFAESIPIDKLPIDPSIYAYEVAFAYKPSTGEAREIGRDIERAYVVNPDEIPGTADVVGLAEDHVYVADWKTGRAPLPPAGKHWQLKLLALMACQAYGRNRAVVELVKLSEHGESFISRAEFDEADMDSIRQEVKEICAEIDAANESGVTLSNLREGDHCKWCPSFRACPAKTSLVKVASRAPDVIESRIRSLINPDELGQAYESWKLLKAVVDELGKAIQEHAAEGPIDLPDGRVFRQVERSRESVNGLVVHQVIANRFGVPAANSSVKITATKKSLNDVIREHWKDLDKENRPTLTDYTDEIMGEIADAGGLVLKPTKSFKVVGSA